MDKRKVEELVQYLLPLYDKDLTVQPECSCFPTEVIDFEIFRSWVLDDEIYAPIMLLHAPCRAGMMYKIHVTDEILSTFSCVNCLKSWKLAEIRALPLGLVRGFLTKLRQRSEELRDWPQRLIEVEQNRVRYTTTRPCTLEELLRARAMRLLELRERHK